MNLDDDDIMQWGKYRNMKLVDVPVDYWRWMLEQEWFHEDKFNDLREYASANCKPRMTYEEAVRALYRFEPRY